MSKKIISVFLIFAISLSFFALPVHAAEGKAVTVSSTGSFWQMVANSNSGFMQYLMGTLSNSIIGNGTVCPESPDAKHYGTPCGGGRNSREVVCRCKYCGEQFVVDESVVEDAYNDYVADLDTPQASAKEGYVDFSVGGLFSEWYYGSYGSYSSSGNHPVLSTYLYSFFGQFFQRPDESTASVDFRSILPDLLLNLDPGRVLILAILSSSYDYQLVGVFPNKYGILQWGVFENPDKLCNSVLFGVYDLNHFTLLESAYSNLTLNDTAAKNDPEYYKRWLVLVDKDFYIYNDYLGEASSYYDCRYRYQIYGRYKAAASSEFGSASWYGEGRNGPSMHFDSISGLSCFESFDAATRKTIYSPDTTQITFSKEYLTHGPSGTTGSSRPGSIAGNWGVMGDDSTVNNIGNQVIVNEDSNTWYNPETGQNEPMESWTYDYATRTYNIVTGDGQTVTVAYGNENLTINNGDVTYNIYYMVDSSQLQESCKHSYTFVTIKDPTCKVAGLDQYTCDFCGHSYTQSSSALGHTWKIKQDVNTQYDDTGTLIQEGYTIYECEICGEQYKSTDGSAPPSVNHGGSSGSGSGSGDSSGGGIFDKLGALLGTLGGGLVSAVGKFFEFILDSLIGLAEMLVDKGVKVIDLILSFFERIPGLFGAFPAFLAAVFPFLPEEFLLILEFGLAAVVFIGIIKWLRK